MKMNDRTDELGRKELLKSAYRKIEELRARLAASEARRSEPVAVVGMGCRFPGGVTDPESFWKLLSEGTDGVTEIPSQRWNIEDYYDPDPEAPGKMYVRRGGFIESVQGFDPLFFHVSPLEAASMDPQQRVLLEVTWEALENAGFAPDQLAGTATGVFIGIGGFDYAMMTVQAVHGRTFETHSATGMSHSITAGHISYFFGLRGPCMALDTACSSALSAIHLATQSLRKGETKMALAGSVNLIISPDGNVVVCKARMLAPDGKCKTFDAAADGYARSEGCGVLVLKLLSQAEADGDRILALIHGVACNQDGRTNGITAPNGNAQREVIQAALAASAISAHDIGYVETHGTGTRLGDPIEVQALGEVFAPDRPVDRKLILGAVKSNIGHLEAAAGIAAVSKAILALQKDQIPANLHFDNPNPFIPWDSLPFQVPTQLTPWPAIPRRLAGVSAFGFSGTNVHMILEQAPHRVPLANEQDRPCHVLCLSAQAPEALAELAKRYAAYLRDNPAANLADLCFTANTGRAHFLYRLAMVASSVDRLRMQLERFVEQPSSTDLVHLSRAPSQPPQVALFITTESMSDVHRQLYRQSPAFKTAIDACDSLAMELFGKALPASLWQPSPSPAIWPSPGDEIVAFALTYAMGSQWHEWGLKPAAMSGSGAGRYVAAVMAGALSLRDGLRLAVKSHAASRPAISWSAPHSTLLSPVTGLPLSCESLEDPAEHAPAARQASEWVKLLTGFQREGIQVVLALGAMPAGIDSMGQSAADLALTCIAEPNDGWSGLLDTVCGLYAAGVAIDWHKFESPWQRQRLALPTYPFQRQDYWLKSIPASVPHKSLQHEQHALLGRRLYSPQFRDEIVFEAEFDTARPPLLKDHRFFETVVVSTTTMLEMSAAAGRIVLKHAAISVDDFLIEQPLLLSEGQASLVQTVLTPEGVDAYSFVILSADIGKLETAPTWQRHCSGKLTKVASSVAPAAEPDKLNRLQARYNQPIDPQWFYRTVAESGVEYGPSFRLMRSVGLGEDGTLALLQIPEDLAGESALYGAHPGLLDSALQALSLAVPFDPEQPGERDVYMPVAVERYRLSMVGLSEMWCQATIRPGAAGDTQIIVGDLQLYSTTGEVIGEVHGVHLKKNIKKQFMQAMIDHRLSNWLYETRWEPLPALVPAANTAGTWLILADESPVAEEFANVIRQRHGRVMVARAGVGFSRQAGDRFTIRLDAAADYDELLKAGTESSEPLRNVVSFLVSPSAEAGAIQTVPRLASSTTEHLLQLTQALARIGAGDLAELALVTEGFQRPSIGIRSSLVGGSAWGLGRVIATELPDLHCKLIDLDQSLPTRQAAEMLADELASQSQENQVALGEGGRLGLRLAHADPANIYRENPLAADARNAVQMEIGTRGDFRQLRFVPQQPQPPGAGEVQLRVLATALNFRDVLNVLGMYPGNPGALGVECVGEIVALGPGVRGWNVGEHVLAMPRRGYCTFANAPQNMIFRRPPNLSLAEASTLLVAYLTAAYSLCHLGRMKAGDRVLIHAASGGVGLAAVQLAQKAGAEVYATAGSPAKREYLRQLGVEHVLDSRSLDFAATIRELTAGQGVDLVLNSLTGQAITEGLSLLRPGGSFLEIGKNELLSDEQATRINPDARYFVVDLLPPFQDTPELMRQLFADVTESLAAGTLRPLPHRTFGLSDAPQAFRHMAAARHIGKVIVVDRSATVTTALESSGTYLITGGLGGLGLSVAQWMVAQGARRVVLVGRSAPSAAAEEVIRELEALGAQIVVARADVGNRQELSDLLAAHTSGSAPLRGVIHSAGVIDDGALLLQDRSRFARVLKPKIDGAWNLHELTIQMPLDFFVLFSSGAGLFGNPGQSSYAAASVFLDGLAAARHAAGLPALSIDWGPWAEVGMAAAMNERHTSDWDSRGLSTIAPTEGLTILQMLIAQSRIAQVAVLPIEKSAWRRQSAGGAVSPLLKNLVDDAGPAPAAISSGSGQAAERLRDAAPGDKRNVLIELVSEMVLDVFGLDRLRSIPPDQNLAMLGMDSLLAIQLSNRLKTSFAAAVPPTLTFQYPTIEAITDYLLTTLATKDEGMESSASPAPFELQNSATELGKTLDPQQAQTILEKLDQLSDRDVETLLSAMESNRDSV